MKKSLEIQVEEKQVAEIKNKVQTVNEQQHQADTALKPRDVSRDERCINCYRGDEYQNRAHAEKKKSSESKRTTRLVRSSELTRRTKKKAKHRVENETNRVKK